MTVFKNWLIGEMGTSGDYQYQAIHFQSLAAVFIAAGIIFFLGFLVRKDSKKSRTLLKAVAIFQLTFEILWRLIYLFIKGDSISCWWPMYPCNLGGILIPLFALMNWQKGKKMFYLFGFVGGILTFAIPDGIFSSDVMVFPIVKSILQHTGLLLIPVLEWISGSYRTNLKDMGWIVTGCFVHILNCEVIDRLFGFMDDYMFFRGDMPFVIPGVPQFITVSVFAVIVLTLLAFLSDIKGSLAFLRSRKEKIKR